MGSSKGDKMITEARVSMKVPTKSNKRFIMSSKMYLFDEIPMMKLAMVVGIRSRERMRPNPAEVPMMTSTVAVISPDCRIIPGNSASFISLYTNTPTM